MSHAQPFMETTIDQGVLVLTVLPQQIEGEQCAEVLKEELLAAVAKHGIHRVVLDLKNTRYVSSIAFWPLLRLRNYLNEREGRLILCGLTGAVAEVFTTTRMVRSNGSANAPFEMAPDRSIAIARLFVIGHDACHGSYTKYDWLNKVIGRIAFLPSLTPFSLWDVGHNVAHHGFTNLKGRDQVWVPMSAEEWQQASKARRVMERIYRSGFGQGLYYLIEMWWKKLILPTKKHVGVRRAIFWWDNVLVLSVGFIAWAILLFPLWVLLISIYILIGNLSSRSPSAVALDHPTG